MLILYFAPGASSMAVHIALNEIGVPFERKVISFAKSEQHSPAFRALNPASKVPTLVIDGRPLTEVAAILFYLAKRYRKPACCPTTISKQRRRQYRGCRLPPLRCIRRDLEESNTQWRYMRSRSESSPEGIGQSALIPLPIFISFDCSGGSPILCHFPPIRFPIYPPITLA
jgi:glutathione S-transferase